MSSRQVQNRARLLSKVFPAYALLRNQERTRRAVGLDLEEARALYLERITGTTPSGLSPRSGTLQEGTAPSLTRLEQLRSELRGAIEELEAYPERFGVVLEE